MLFGKLMANWPDRKPRAFHMQMVANVFRQRYELALIPAINLKLPITYPYREDRVTNALVRQRGKRCVGATKNNA